MRLGIIGLGKVGEAIAQGIKASQKGAVSIEATTRSKESADAAEKKLGIPCGTSNRELAKTSEVLVLAVKPHQAEAVILEIAGSVTPDLLIISVVASITTKQIQEWLGKKTPVIRAMPNTPCLIGQGMTALSPSSFASKKHLETAEKIFSAIGRTTVVEENLMDAVTGLSGCGPAYAYLVIEALSEAGVKVGISRETSTLLAAQTLLGASQMVLERGVHPAALKDEVTTPAGCTIDGLVALEEGKVRVAFIKAVVAATKRSKRLKKI